MNTIFDNVDDEYEKHLLKFTIDTLDTTLKTITFAKYGHNNEKFIHLSFIKVVLINFVCNVILNTTNLNQKDALNVNIQEIINGINEWKNSIDIEKYLKIQQKEKH